MLVALGSLIYKESEGSLKRQTTSLSALIPGCVITVRLLITGKLKQMSGSLKVN